MCNFNGNSKTSPKNQGIEAFLHTYTRVEQLIAAVDSWPINPADSRSISLGARGFFLSKQTRKKKKKKCENDGYGVNKRVQTNAHNNNNYQNKTRTQWTQFAKQEVLAKHLLKRRPKNIGKIFRLQEGAQLFVSVCVCIVSRVGVLKVTLCICACVCSVWLWLLLAFRFLIVAIIFGIGSSISPQHVPSRLAQSFSWHRKHCASALMAWKSRLNLMCRCCGEWDSGWVSFLGAGFC